ncbi:MAG: 1,5-anhydro-D-fructose reductase [bacterium ADurb.Bin429]|nr:MAG: 1,5-anhydro-D-fructose reductase [bacterium ADurb.Bin429]
MVNVGIIGMAGIAGAHLGGYDKCADARVVACCDVDPAKAERGAEQGARAYLDYRELLADPEVDAVSICLPTFLHADATVAALRAGKHVLCEKPMALTSADGDRMIAAAEAAGHVLMIAHCIRFWPEYQALKTIVEGGAYGAVQSALFTRLGGLPAWSANGWMRDPARSGGAILDLHIHDADYIAYLFGMPRRVRARGVETEFGINDLRVEYDYDDGRMIAAESAWYPSEHYPFQATFRVALERAVVQLDGRRPLTVYPTAMPAFEPVLPPGDGYANEIADFIRCITRGACPSVAPAASSRDSLRLIEAEAAAVRTGEAVPVTAGAAT